MDDLPIRWICSFYGWIIVDGNAFHTTFDQLHTHLSVSGEVRATFVKIFHHVTVL